ncbi:MAG: hypothetical protein HQ546_07015 [Planctomycetes bacterium]|nr:hypothetical protein [Planctomycetota bacterium]
MATLLWRGDALAVAQIDTLTPANVGIGDTFTATINGKSITVTATAATVANVTGLMTTAWNATEIPEFAEVTASDSTTHVTLTADTAGKPFTVTATEADGDASDDQTFSQATTTANAGPNVLAAANFRDISDDSMGLPTSGDFVHFKDSSVSMLYALEAISGVDLGGLHIWASYTGSIGLPRLNEDQDGGAELDYDEYRPLALLHEGGPLFIGEGSGAGSGRIKLDTATYICTAIVYKTGSSPDDNYAVQIDSYKNTSTLMIYEGEVDLGADPMDDGLWATVTVKGNGKVRTHYPRAEITTLTAGENAICEIYDDCTTTWVTGSADVTFGPGIATQTVIHCLSGTIRHLGDNTITTLHIGVGGAFDASNAMGTLVITNCTCAAGAAIVDPNNRTNFSNPIDVGDADAFTDFSFQFGPGRNITPAAPGW